MKMKFIVSASAALFLTVYSVSALPGGSSKEYRQAVRLYESGMYERARTLFETMSPGEASPMSDGYAVLCGIKLHTAGYEEGVKEFFRRYGATPLNSEIHHDYALNLFDEQRYFEAAQQFDAVARKTLTRSELTELLFKRAYCDYGQGNYDEAMTGFAEVVKRPQSEYTAPSQYAMGYIRYSENAFAEAFDFFAESAKDPRFQEQSEYYMLECSFMQRDYAYVAAHGDEIFNNVPEERKSHLARILSESYLVMGNPGKAKKFYDLTASEENAVESRADSFYAGSLQYALGDYAKAISHFNNMGERNDSIGQIASYQMGWSYIQTKNKVLAMDAFKQASALDFDKKIKEDAHFNHAKLAFDLNHDSSVFKDYMKTYKDNGRSDMIYDYIAVASLFNRDYVGAVEAYDNIESLTPAMKSNYMKANYLRAEQLISGGSYTDAIPCLKAATFFTTRQDNFNKLARYWLAESYYKTEKYSEAENIFTDLYNLAALDSRTEGRILAYNAAYSYFQEENYPMAATWFDHYLDNGDKTFRKDAMIRRADCDFLQKEYQSSAQLYGKVVDEFGDADNVYPYYQQGLAYGLDGKKNDKVEALSKVLSASPDAAYYSEALYELGRSYVAVKKESKAVEVFTKLVENSRNNNYVAKGLIELGMIERNNSRYDAALSCYKQVVEKFRGTESADVAMLAIESIYQSQGAPEKYLAYTESLGQPSKSAEEKEQIYFNSAEQVFLTANYEKAIVALDKYLEAYPQGSRLADACFYKGECYRSLGNKEKACESYYKVMNMSQSSFRELSLLHYADLSFEMEHFSDAFMAYNSLLSAAQMDESKASARRGMMRAAYYGRDYERAISCAQTVKAGSDTQEALSREADYIMAKSLLATSHRDEAFAIFRNLSAKPATDEGAEATYLLIQDTYDQGRFSEVEKAVYAFANAAPKQAYWLAKSYIVLGDSFVENDNIRQARATFESVRDGYEPASGSSDDVTENVRMRLEKLNQLTN